MPQNLNLRSVITQIVYSYSMSYSSFTDIIIAPDFNGIARKKGDQFEFKCLYVSLFAFLSL